jgi:hypothetical protein
VLLLQQSDRFTPMLSAERFQNIAICPLSDRSVVEIAIAAGIKSGDRGIDGAGHCPSRTDVRALGAEPVKRCLIRFHKFGRTGKAGQGSALVSCAPKVKARLAMPINKLLNVF